MAERRRIRQRLSIFPKQLPVSKQARIITSARVPDSRPAAGTDSSPIDQVVRMAQQPRSMSTRITTLLLLRHDIADDDRVGAYAPDCDPDHDPADFAKPSPEKRIGVGDRP
ncbi:hypothetical protein [Nocardia arthritidis]|uniref:Uncharacterized protein n=1 Tax=Nocardia arthritidis TaxID=228602 RepID=A0A6G9YNP1_9NOCA|nr:hypothetical protein [Nocardia arthritidis]QIS14824.1 hypothetical protein F5544_34955 [Nocardia arthritidis]